MNDKKLFDRIRALVKAYTGRPDDPFGREYATTVRDGVRNGSLTAEDAALLDDVCRTLEGWHRETQAPPGTPFADWLRLYDATGDRLPTPLLDTLLSKVPAKAAKAVDPETLVLQRGDRRLLTMLVQRKILKTADLTRVAKAHPAEFYRSSALDLLLEQRACPPRAVWACLADGEERADGLMPGPEALAEAFVNDRANDGPSWLVGFLAANATVRPQVLVQILRDTATLEKLVRHLGVAATGTKGKRKEQVWESVDTVVRDLLELCVHAIDEGRRTGPGAIWAVGTLALAAHAPGAPFASGTVRHIEEASGRLGHPTVLAALRAADDGKAPANLPIVISGRHLAIAVQEYLQTLPLGAGDADPAERAARFQRYAGRREVIEELLPLLDQAEKSGVPYEALDAALFNVGLRPLGVSEGSDTFDPHQHEPGAPGILPGEPIKIVRPGWRIGESDDGIVLVKARVIPNLS